MGCTDERGWGMKHQLTASMYSRKQIFRYITILVHGGATPQSAREVTPLNPPKQSILGRELRQSRRDESSCLEVVAGYEV